MPISLYDAFVPSAEQMLANMHHLLDTAARWAESEERSEAEVVGARLHPDMLPFAYQVKSVAEHSAGAVRALGKGVFSPNTAAPPGDFTGLRARIAEAEAELGATDADEFERWMSAPMRFAFGDFSLPFSADQFLLSFSQPNFYFHASTAYGILRHLGVPVGKRDFMGKMRLAL